MLRAPRLLSAQTRRETRTHTLLPPNNRQPATELGARRRSFDRDPTTELHFVRPSSETAPSGFINAGDGGLRGHAVFYWQRETCRRTLRGQRSLPRLRVVALAAVLQESYRISEAIPPRAGLGAMLCAASSALIHFNSSLCLDSSLFTVAPYRSRRRLHLPESRTFSCCLCSEEMDSASPSSRWPAMTEPHGTVASQLEPGPEDARLL